MKIRRNVFETNSSSTHSVSIIRGNKPESQGLVIDKETKKVKVSFGEFGWDRNEYTDPLTKLSYLLTMTAETEAIHNPNVTDFFKTEGFQAINNLICEKLDCEGIYITSTIEIDPTSNYYHMCIDGYIDHQSCESYHSLKDFLNDYSLDIEEFIFNPEVVLITDNDNDFGFYEVEED